MLTTLRLVFGIKAEHGSDHAKISENDEDQDSESALR
jgi:hypothetical protein